MRLIPSETVDGVRVDGTMCGDPQSTIAPPPGALSPHLFLPFVLLADGGRAGDQKAKYRSVRASAGVLPGHPPANEEGFRTRYGEADPQGLRLLGGNALLLALIIAAACGWASNPLAEHADTPIPTDTPSIGDAGMVDALIEEPPEILDVQQRGIGDTHEEPPQVKLALAARRFRPTGWYRLAAHEYGISSQLLEALHQVESNGSGDSCVANLRLGRPGPSSSNRRRSRGSAWTPITTASWTSAGLPIPCSRRRGTFKRSERMPTRRAREAVVRWLGTARTSRGWFPSHSRIEIAIGADQRSPRWRATVSSTVSTSKGLAIYPSAP